MRAVFGTLLVATFAVAALADPVPGPNPIYDASQYMTLKRTVAGGSLYEVSAPNDANLKVMHLYGDAKERGFAHGLLLGDELLDFAENQLPKFYDEQIDSLPLPTLPEWLQKAIKGLAKDIAPGAMELALGYVYDEQKKFIDESKSDVSDELAGIAAGACANRTNGLCAGDASKTLRMLEHVNMLPELIRMQCSMLGAWDTATPDGKLTQLRSLDFGAGPFANRTLLIVYHPPNAPAFASLSFPGFVGAVTGFSESIGLSQKVDDVTGGPRPHGTYRGKTATVVIRDILQFARSKEDAVAIAQASKRTWSMWLGFGDYTSQEFVAMLYDEASANAYNDTTLPKLTNQTEIPHVAYIVRSTRDMPALVHQYYGNLSAVNVAQNLPRLMETGDVHISVRLLTAFADTLQVYDFGNNQTMIASGLTDQFGNFTRKVLATSVSDTVNIDKRLYLAK